MTQDSGSVWWQGLVAGLIGYAVLALFFGVVNLLLGESFFHTAAMLGHALTGTEPAAGAEVRAAPVFAYNGVHLLLFLVFGFVAAWLVEETERHPLFWYLVFFALMVGLFYNVVLATLFTLPVAAAEISWLTIVLANLAAGAAMGWYLVRRHPGFLDEVEAGGDPEGV